ncbi:hypothetical protein ACLB2K_066340 [Fragaria x ananassa]
MKLLDACSVSRIEMETVLSIFDCFGRGSVLILLMMMMWVKLMILYFEEMHGPTSFAPDLISSGPYSSTLGSVTSVGVTLCDGFLIQGSSEAFTISG